MAQKNKSFEKDKVRRAKVGKYIVRYENFFTDGRLSEPQKSISDQGNALPEDFADYWNLPVPDTRS